MATYYVQYIHKGCKFFLGPFMTRDEAQNATELQQKQGFTAWVLTK
jgi:hypothetical protein